jgi:PAS domain S-box-containing protein
MKSEELKSLPEHTMAAEMDAQSAAILQFVGVTVSFVLLLSVFYMLNRDISERKRTEEMLRKSEATFSGIISIADDAIISIDESHRIILFNEGAERTFGYSEAEVLGKPLEILIPENFRQTHKAHLQAFAQSPVMARKMGERREILGRRKNSEQFSAEASISKLELGGEKIFTVVLRDVTERKQAEEERERLVNELQAALAEVKQLRGIIPICSYCKNIRKDENYWEALETYITEHSDAQFSHGICPKCYEEKVKPQLIEYKERLSEAEQINPEKRPD